MLINGVQSRRGQGGGLPRHLHLHHRPKNISYGKSNKLIVKSVSDYPEGMSDIQPTVTSAGEKAFTKAVEDSLDKCMKSKKIKNAELPEHRRPDHRLREPNNGTLEWSYDKDALDNMKIRLDYDQPGHRREQRLAGHQGRRRVRRKALPAHAPTATPIRRPT